MNESGLRPWDSPRQNSGRRNFKGSNGHKDLMKSHRTQTGSFSNGTGGVNGAIDPVYAEIANRVTRSCCFTVKHNSALQDVDEAEVCGEENDLPVMVGLCDLCDSAHDCSDSF